MLTEEELRKTVKAVYDFNAKNGYCPSIREIAEEIGRGLPATQSRLKKLERMGYLSHEPNQNRTLTVTRKGIAFVFGLKSI